MLHHPWRALEHAALASTTTLVLVLWRKLHRKRRYRAVDSLTEDPSALILKAVAELKLAAGPSAVLDGSWPNVAPAPPPSMDAASLREGQTSTLTDGRGSIYRFKVRALCCIVCAIPAACMRGPLLGASGVSKVLHTCNTTAGRATRYPSCPAFEFVIYQKLRLDGSHDKPLSEGACKLRNTTSCGLDVCRSGRM